tara:strand:+ start:99 stop:470 length:372 start_codon:yes stop_codon:yes gene_type:complete
MINFLKKIFIWWEQQTIGTMLYTLFFGKLKGEDNNGNRYYESKKGNRWVVYKKDIEASKISSEWYLWIHHTNNKDPQNKKINKIKYTWQKDRLENMTGTNKAYRPKKILENTNIKKKYETWKN